MVTLSPPLGSFIRIVQTWRAGQPRWAGQHRSTACGSDQMRTPPVNSGETWRAGQPRAPQQHINRPLLMRTLSVAAHRSTARDSDQPKTPAGSDQKAYATGPQR